MRTFIYVDGFNLYYGALKGTAWKWLDLPALFAKVLQPHHDILTVKYFTVRVSGTPADQSKPQRQDVYLRALRHYRPEVEVYFGHFLSHSVRVPLVRPVGNRRGTGDQDRGKRLGRQSRRASPERQLAGRLRLRGSSQQRQRYCRSNATRQAPPWQAGRADNAGDWEAVSPAHDTCGFLKTHQADCLAELATAKPDSRHQYQEAWALVASEGAVQVGANNFA